LSSESDVKKKKQKTSEKSDNESSEEKSQTNEPKENKSETEKEKVKEKAGKSQKAGKLKKAGKSQKAGKSEQVGKAKKEEQSSEEENDQIREERELKQADNVVVGWEHDCTVRIKGVPTHWTDESASKRLVKAFAEKFMITTKSLTRDYNTDTWILSFYKTGS